ncbi:MAG: hypothetical protein Q8K89_14035, partial [Actinomycetota bacterium]|nr:hypothetical protein [Actinomycetota bacterium]
CRVESALSEDGLPGRDYLEKILQVTHDIPPISDQVLMGQITQAINEALDDVDAGSFGHERWPDVFMEVIRPLIRNMRDVRRYAASLRGAVIGLDARVDSVCVFHANRSANTPACRSPIPLMPITLGAKRRSGSK